MNVRTTRLVALTTGLLALRCSLLAPSDAELRGCGQDAGLAADAKLDDAGPVFGTGATMRAASCSREDVGTALASASAGDVVVIPAGTCRWSTTLTILKGITLIGAGEGQTVLEDDVPKGGANCVGAGPLLSWNVGSTQKFRLSGLSIKGVAADPAICQAGHVKLAEGSQAFRVDHLTIDPVLTAAIVMYGSLAGVIDHVTARGDSKIKVRARHESWGGASFGDGSWAEPLSWGTDKAIYVEDCRFEHTDASSAHAASIEAGDGARLVVRHNTFHNESIGALGTDSSQRSRGTRSLELYENTFAFEPGLAIDAAVQMGSGTGVVFKNAITAETLNVMVQAQNCRDGSPGCSGGPSYPPWGACNGRGPYDQNSNPTGYRCVDQPGSGTSRLLTGDPPATGWIGNVSDPIYAWGNTLNGGPNDSIAGSTNVQPNRDYFSAVVRPGYTPYAYPHPLTR
jgi:hypothetical protein